MVEARSNWMMHSTMHVAPMDSTMSRQNTSSFVLWVDAVGGFLVCPKDRVVVGQALPAAGVDVAIQADLSRRHATIHRDGEGYVIAPASSTSVDGKAIRGAAGLKDGNIIQLGSLVRMTFRQPHPLSASACLTMDSHHRTQPNVDGVILMADSLVMGPGRNSHIVARGWNQQVLLFRQDEQWFCRSDGPFEVNGASFRGEAAPVALGAQIRGKEFSMSLESV